MKIKLNAIFTLLFILFAFTQVSANVNGTVGALYEWNDTYGLIGMFVEINSGIFGGYISATGNRDSNCIRGTEMSLANVNLGFSLLYRNRVGITPYIGFHERAYINTVHVVNLARKVPVEDNMPHGGVLNSYSEKYFEYGVGAFTYILSKYITLHVKYTYIPHLQENYIGLGAGVHIF